MFNTKTVVQQNTVQPLYDNAKGLAKKKKH